MKMENNKNPKVKKFDRGKSMKILKRENDYVLNLLETFNVPDSVEDEDLDDLLAPTDGKPIVKFPKLANAASRAQTAEELEQRLEMIKNKLKSKKPKASAKEKKKKEVKRLKNKMNHKKILKVEQLKREAEENEEIEDTKEKQTQSQSQSKPVFNADGKMIFSKFDFASRPGIKTKKPKKDKTITNPREALKNLKEQKKQINELIEQGEEEKALQIKQELAWKKVFDRTEGKKVKDDPALLHKSIKKRKVQKKKSKQKWTERKEKVEQDIAGRQKKRKENIDRKIREKKVNKMKRLTKRGRVIPGF